MDTLHTAWLSERLKSLWYTVIHELLPTNERLAAIHLTETDRCKQCGEPDTLQHRLRENGEGALIWKWTRARIAALLRMDPPFHTRRLAPPSHLPILAAPEAGCDCMDVSTYGGVPHAKAKTFIAQRLHRLSASRQMEGLSESRQTTNRGKLPQYRIMETLTTPQTSRSTIPRITKGGLNLPPPLYGGHGRKPMNTLRRTQSLKLPCTPNTMSRNTFSTKLM